MINYLVSPKPLKSLKQGFKEYVVKTMCVFYLSANTGYGTSTAVGCPLCSGPSGKGRVLVPSKCSSRTGPEDGRGERHVEERRNIPDIFLNSSCYPFSTFGYFLPGISTMCCILLVPAFGCMYDTRVNGETDKVGCTESIPQ